MRLEELNWFDVEKYLQQDDRLMIVLGACEQHGYLSLATDIKIPVALADVASEQTGVLIAPSVNYGCSPYFLDYSGTLSIRVTTLFCIVEDIIRVAYRQGFRRFLIVNGHGGNEPVRTHLYELLNEMPDMQAKWYSWWLSHSVQVLAEKYDIKPRHANWLEAFTFTRVAELPEGDKTPPFTPGLTNAKQTREVYEDGSFGGPYQVDDSIMQELFSVCVKDIIDLLDFSKMEIEDD